MRSPLLEIWFVLCCFFAFVSGANAEERVYSVTSAESLDLFDCLYVQEDPTNSVAPEVMFRRPFQEPCRSSPQLGFFEHDLWIRVRLRNRTPVAIQRFLEYDNSMVHTLDVFVFDESGRRLSARRDGYGVPDARELPLRYRPSFRVDLPAGAERVVLLRVRTDFYVRAFLRLNTPEEAHRKVIRESVGHGIFYGIAGLLFLVGVIALFVLRQRFFLFMPPALFLYLMLFVVHDGVYFALRGLWPWNHDLIPIAMIAGSPLGNIFALLFLADLMGIRARENPRAFGLLASIGALYAVAFVLYFVRLTYGIILFQAAASAGGVIVTVLLVKAWRRGQRHLRYVLLGFLPGISIAPVVLLVTLGIVRPIYLDISDMGYPLLFMLVCFIVSALDRLSQVSRNYADQLAIEVRNKTAELEAARNRAEDASEFKESLVRMVAHDLRSPLSAVSGSLPLLNPDLSVKNDDRAIVWREMTRTINGILKFVHYLLSEKNLREGSLQFQPAWCNLRDIAREAGEQTRPLFSAKGVELENRAEPVEWQLDPEYMYRILGNLLSNAVKFSRAGDRVTLETPEPNTIAVADTGVGMAREVLAALREEQRVSTPGTAGEGGRGMGLQQCFELIRLQQGTFEIDSTPGAGSRFTIRWPEGRWRRSAGKKRGMLQAPRLE